VATTGEVPSQSGPIRTGTFNPEGNDLAKTGGPPTEAFVAIRSRGHPVLSQASAKLVNGYGYMFVSVRVDANNDPGGR